MLAAKEQKETELKIVEVNNSRAEESLRSLLRSLQIIAPDQYEMIVGVSTSRSLSPGLSSKKARYALRNQKAEVKIGDAQSRLDKVLEELDEIKARVKLLKRERNLLLHPEMNAKNELSNYSQTMVSGTERIRQYLHSAALMAIECDYLDKVRDDICSKACEPVLMRLQKNIAHMKGKITAMKSKFDEIVAHKHTTHITSACEVEELEQKATESDKVIEDLEEKVCDSVDEITKYIARMRELGLSVPEIPRTCTTLRAMTMVNCL